MNRWWMLVVALAVAVAGVGQAVMAQVDSDGNLNFLVSNSALRGPESGGPNLIFRNRYDCALLTGYADALAMDRVGSRNVVLLRDGAGTELFNAKDFGFDWEVGPRVGVIAHDLFLGNDIEVGYFGIDGYSATHTSFSGPNTSVNYSVPGFSAQASGGTGIQFNYRSQIHSGELNVRKYLADRIIVLAGARWVELHEDLDGSFAFAGGATTQFMNINVDNHLYGGQIGLDAWLFDDCRKFNIGTNLKAGIFGNFADQTVTVTGLTNPLGDKIDHVAFLGEINLMAVYQLAPHCTIRGGYQVLWLEGVALASDQAGTIDFTGTNFSPDVGGSLLYHGAFAGLEISF